MKTLSFIILTLLTLPIAYAQSPSPDTIATPVKQGDPEVRQIPHDIRYTNEVERLGPEQLPMAIQRNLQKEMHDDWKKSVIYRNKNNDTYTIELRSGRDTRIYHFNKNGKRIDNAETSQYKQNKN